MEKEFVTYELALKLKQLGFDNVPCLAIWYNIPELDDYEFFDFHNHFSYQHYETQYYANKGFKDAVLCPLYQQAFRWFREKYQWTIEVNQVTKNNWSYTLKNFSKERTYYGGSYETFEVAEIACLEKLIEFIEREK
jgi:hypothetical protein